jgi:hypothetical protein
MIRNLSSTVPRPALRTEKTSRSCHGDDAFSGLACSATERGAGDQQAQEDVKDGEVVAWTDVDSDRGPEERARQERVPIPAQGGKPTRH